ncbi:MAG: hypothetical protein H7196_04815 [candidate division SR1 bacterium]|nr:hypothetical protein [candidate division SR1 bacterium]
METSLKIVACHITVGHHLRLIGCLASNYKQVVYKNTLDMRSSSFVVNDEYELIITKFGEEICKIPFQRDWLIFITDNTPAATYMIPVEKGQMSIYSIITDTVNPNNPESGIIKLVQYSIPKLKLKGDYRQNYINSNIFDKF